jgi:hypothetical protein
MTILPQLSRFLLLSVVLAAPLTPAAANDFPTVDRVLYVQECMRNNPGPGFEMTNKCSCALEAIAAEVSYDDYVTMTTAVKAVTIGGERGGELRDNPTIRPQIKRWREIEAKAYGGCFIVRR